MNMKKVFYLLFALLVGLSACSGKDEPSGQTPETPETPENPGSNPSMGKTLIVYYSFTNNVHRIVTDLSTQIKADVIRVQPAEKGVLNVNAEYTKSYKDQRSPCTSYDKKQISASYSNTVSVC